MANFAYNDLKISPHKLSYENYDFYFSSAFHKNKFIKEVDEFIKNENLKIVNRYKVNIDLKELFVLSFYIKCESRGFYAIKNGIEIKPELKCYLL